MTTHDAAPAPGRAAPRLAARLPGFVLGCAGALAAIAIWSLASHALQGGGGVLNRLPGPLAVLRELARYVGADFLRDLVSSLEVFAIGWVLGVVTATLAGLLLGRVALAGAVFLPVVEAIRPVSSIAWVPLSIVWFGFGLGSKVFLVGLAVFLVVIVYAVDGCSRVPPDLERTASMLGMRRWQRFRHLVLPSTMTEVLIGSRVALMAGWGTVIVAELVAADSGLGAHLIGVEQSYDVPAVMAAMICFGLSGFVMNALFTRLEHRLVPWRRDAAENGA
jgi:ABC-type nitrate/sulfonate/bicarbonate transport system permease component